MCFYSNNTQTILKGFYYVFDTTVFIAYDEVKNNFQY